MLALLAFTPASMTLSYSRRHQQFSSLYQSTMSAQDAPAPSQLAGQAKTALGVVESTIGSVIPEAAGSQSWLDAGEQLQKDGQREVHDAKNKKAVEATVDAGFGKAKSALGYVTGNQEKQNEGNVEAEKAQWSYKQATTDSIAAIPVPSVEGAKGKLQSVAGMVTGDQGKQQEGNIRAEKAAWKDGV